MSNDLGSTWTLDGFIDSFVLSLCVVDSELFAGISEQGIWRRPISISDSIAIINNLNDQSVPAPTSAIFSIDVIGNSPSYIWEELIPGGPWSILANGGNYSIIDNGNSSVLTIINTSGYNGYQYRCIVYNNLPSSDTSQSALLTVGTSCIPISIISNSGGQSVIAPTVAQFTITTTGTSPTYQWQLLIPGGSGTGFGLEVIYHGQVE